MLYKIKIYIYKYKYMDQKILINYFSNNDHNTIFPTLKVPKSIQYISNDTIIFHSYHHHKQS